MKILGLIPTRLGSTRIPSKPLLEIKNIPLIIHTYKRAIMSKLLDDVIICCDDIKILNIAKKFNAKAILNSKKHNNGTERIAEGFLKQKKKYDLIVDIQGDEPLLNPKHIDQIIKFHKKNLKTDIILPSLKLKNPENSNIVKVITDTKNNIICVKGSTPGARGTWLVVEDSIKKKEVKDFDIKIPVDSKKKK